MFPHLAALGALFRAYPVRSAVHSVAPLLLAAGQSVNAVVHGVTSPLVAGFVLAMLAFAVASTAHALASFRTESLEREFLERRL